MRMLIASKPSLCRSTMTRHSERSTELNPPARFAYDGFAYSTGSKRGARKIKGSLLAIAANDASLVFMSSDGRSHNVPPQFVRCGALLLGVRGGDPLAGRTE